MNKSELKQAFEEHLITEEQFKDELFKLEQQPKKPKIRRKIPDYLTKEEFTRLIKATKKLRHKTAFLLGWGSGLRVSEVVKLKPEDVHIAEKNILVKEGKGNKDRITPLPKGFKEKMLRCLPMKCGARALQKALKSTAKRAGLLETKPDLHFHSLRHSFGTIMAERGIPIHHIKNLMGHSNISTTSIYLAANPKEALKSYEELF